MSTIHEVQGVGHRSPFVGEVVTVEGVIVTAVLDDGFYIQDPSGDRDPRTSDGIFVFTDSLPTVSVGDKVNVTGEVSEFQPGGEANRNLTTTQFAFPDTIEVVSEGNPLPTPVLIGEGGRIPPSENIDDDAFAEFNPDEAGIDFFESLEGMLVTAQNPVAIGPTNRFGEIFTVVDNGEAATGISDRGTLNISPDDFNPERVQIDYDSDLLPDFDFPQVNVGTQLKDVTGVVGYSFGNFEILPTQAFSATASELEPETSAIATKEGNLTLASYNVLNLDPNDEDGEDTDVADGRFERIATQIVDNLNSPDVIGLQEIQDNDGEMVSDVSAADVTLQTLVDAIAVAGGPTYEFIDTPGIVPAFENEAGEIVRPTGGAPGGNIRNAFLFNPERVNLVEGSVEPLTNPQEQAENPNNPFFGSRIPLRATFELNGEEVTVINNHFSSKGGSSGILGLDQPFEELQNGAKKDLPQEVLDNLPAADRFVNGSYNEREAQAEAVKEYVDSLDVDNIVALGDFNEFEFVDPIQETLGSSLNNLIETLPEDERYSFIFQGNSQVLDHIFVSDNLTETTEFDIVHTNAEFTNPASDHEPLVASINLSGDNNMAIELNPTGTFETGVFDEGAAEIVAYDAESQRLFVVNSDATTVDILDVSDPTNPTRINQIDATQFGDGANSVTVNNGVVAVAIEAEEVGTQGQVVFFDIEGNQLAPAAPVGFLPDMVTFSPDGTKVLVANEGEPSDDYSVDPEGSVTIIDLELGQIFNADFTAFNDQKEALVNRGVRIFGPSPNDENETASVAQDLEPEYITVTPDSNFAYVSLQENNALGVIDLRRIVDDEPNENFATVVDVLPLGFKDHSKGLPTLEQFELSDELLAANPLLTPEGPSEVPLGGLSGLFFEGVAENGNLQFITHPDIGPSTSEDTNNDGNDDVTTYQLPDHQPTLYRFELNQETGEISFTETIALNRPDGNGGTIPLTGLPNLEGDDEGLQPVNAAGEPLDFDPFGADLEGIVVNPADETFWAVDEYRPSIYHFDQHGTLIDRFVPKGTDPDTSDNVTFGRETLPEAYLSARDGRGFEAVSLDTEAGILYAFIQTPLGNDGTGEFNSEVSANSQVIRMLGIDPATGEPVAEYAYLLEKPAFSEGNIDKIADATFAGNNKFFLVERDSGTESTSNKVVYEINLSGATNLLGEEAPSLPENTTLEQLDADELAAQGIRPVSKTEVTNLPSLGYLPSDKPEGIAQLPDGSLAVLNDNDFEPEAKDTSLGIISFDKSNQLDASDEDGINLQNIPSFGMLQPDAIDSFEVEGQNFIITANEGDAREYEGDPGLIEEVGLDDLAVNATPITATLTGDQEVPPVNTEATGTATMSFNPSATAFDYKVTVDDLDFGEFLDGTPQTPDDEGDDVTLMHIHGAPRGENGPVIFGVISPDDDIDDREFTLNDDGSVTISGTWDSGDGETDLEEFADQVSDAGFEQELDFYWNIHTEEFPAGEIRGQLERGAPESFLDLNDDNRPDAFTDEVVPGETLNDLLAEDRLGALDFTNATGDIDEDGLIEQLHNFGGRSFSIFDEFGNLVFDSGDEFERITAEQLPNDFNSDNTENDSFDSRSDAKGPEPEAIITGVVEGTTYAFIGLERVGGIMVYELSNPSNPEFVQYVNNRTFRDADGNPIPAQLEDGTVNPEVGDLGPEGFDFISAEESPSGEALLAVGNEVSGTTTLFSVSDMVEEPEPEVPQPSNELELSVAGTFETGVFDEGAAEIVAYDAETQRLFVVNSDATTVDILDVSDPTSPTRIDQIDATAFGDSANSVAVNNGIVAVAIAGEAVDAKGQVVFFDSDGNELNSVEVGVLPDMVTFSPDGSKVLTANEGEPSDDYETDPEGSVSIIDISGGVENATVTNAGFTAFNDQQEALEASGVRIFGPDATVAQDLEPEYITVSPDSSTAYVALQENNAFAVVDLNAGAVTDILPLGFKDHSQIGNKIDPSANGEINIQNVPTFGMLQPDAIATFETNDETYIITANEGDSRDYDSFSEEATIGDLQEEGLLDLNNDGEADESDDLPFAELNTSDQLGNLLLTNSTGDVDEDGLIEQLHSFGGRSFSIFNEAGELVFDSGEDFERIVAEQIPEGFNTTNDENDSFDDRSSDKGPEPEAVATGVIGGTPYAFIGLERVGGIMVYNVSNPTDPQFVQYLNNRDFSVQFDTDDEGDPNPTQEQLSQARDLGPEGFDFISAEESPNGNPLLAVGNEVSGTTTLYNIADIGQEDPSDPSEDPSESFTLQLFHASDLEGGVDAIDNAPNFAAIIDQLEEEFENTLTISAGDNVIPGPFFNAALFAEDQVLNDAANTLFGLPNDVNGDGQPEQYESLAGDRGRIDMSIMNAIGFDASAIGNHEFDAGSDALASFIGPALEEAGLADDEWLGTQFPYLSANLNFSNNESLSSLATDQILSDREFVTGPEESFFEEITPRIAPAAIFERGGEQIGVVGATTPLLQELSSPGDTEIVGPSENNVQALADVLQPVIDEIADQGVNKIILTTHLQQIALEQELMGELSGVDIVIAGGSDTLLADETDTLRPGDEADDSYPLLTENADGDPAAIVSSAGEYSYVGRLVAEFDANGVLVPESIDPEISGTFATTEDIVTEVSGDTDPFAEGTKGSQVQNLVNSVETIVNEQDGNLFGQTEVFLDGRREEVRTEETNLGNLTADANLATAQAEDESVVVSIKNGGGIRAPIGEVGDNGELLPPQANPDTGKEDGQISQLDLVNSLRFNNGLTLLTVTRSELEQLVEHGVAGTAPGNTPGQFPQVGGLEFSFDPTQQAIEFNDDGSLITEGDRVQSLAITDDNGEPVDVIVENGELVGNPDEEIRLVTLNFLADGGDGYPFDDFGENRLDLVDSEAERTGEAIFADDGSEQDALAEFLVENFPIGGNTAFDEAETAPAEDERIVNLSVQNGEVETPESPDSPESAVLEEPGVFDLTNEDVFGPAGEVVTANLASEVISLGVFNNLVGFYTVADEAGGIDTDDDGIVDLTPGEDGYTEAALANAKDAILKEGQTGSIELTSGEIVVPFLLAQGGKLDEIPGELPAGVQAYFPYIAANADGVDHFRLLSDNSLGIEDLAGGGDQDFNDLVFQLDFA